MNSWGAAREIEKAKAQQIETNDLLSAKYPSVAVEAHRLHVFKEGGEWCVWLNTEVADFDGLCIGLGDTREAALLAARKTLAAVLNATI